ncbi:tubulin polyglutamylase TTLL13-like [Watersipora subatra]|uniref:tubulin polyglutamylase TTLL13-like n=1 Tax=Watersipora subatra TaxID=2589382 RepID=UPI00355C9BF1
MPSRADDDESCSSSSDSEDEQATPYPSNGNKGLTLLDDEANTDLVLPPDDRGESEAYLGETDSYRELVPELPDTSTESKTKTEEADGDNKPKKKKKKRKILYICTSNCKYDSIRRVSKKVGFREVAEEDEWNLFWTDYSVALERVMEMKRYQKINHFPGMTEICRKDLLSRNLNKMIKLFPKEYNVFPKSWVLPADYGDFLSFSRQKKNKTYILKPASGCQGKGIWVTRNVKEIKAHEHMVCQQYLSRPFLIDGFKFDFRLYVLVTSCDPLRIFCFKDGLARFATVPYHDPNSGNTDNVFMHLTNYAINKTSENFIRDDEEGGSKRRITTINRWWKENGYDLDKIWADIDDVVIKTLISISDILIHNYRTCFPNHTRGSACFEILGFDVMFDRKLKPYVVEVNHSPSFHTDAVLDKEIKESLLYDTMNLVNCGAVDKKKVIEEERRKIKERLFNRGPGKKETKEELEIQQAAYLKQLDKFELENMNNFRRIYPRPDMEKYEKFFHSSGSLFQETAAYKARSEAARVQREEIRQKQEKLDSILKRKKNDSSARPESPGGGRRRTRRPLLNSRRVNQTQQKSTDGSLTVPRTLSPTSIDTMTAQEISENEELDRISGLLQRENLIRGLGIPEHVYRMLHTAPGTVHTQTRPQEPSEQAQQAAADYNTAQSLLSLINPSTSSAAKHSTFVASTQRRQIMQGFVSPSAQNGTTQWQRGKLANTKKHGVEVDADRKSLMRNALSDAGSANTNYYNPRTFSGTVLIPSRDIFGRPGARKTVAMNQPSLGLDVNSLGITTQGYSSKVQPANTQHLSVISAPAPVMQRPDLPPSRKLASLENALRGAGSRLPARKTVKLKTLEAGPNTLVYS